MIVSFSRPALLHGDSQYVMVSLISFNSIDFSHRNQGTMV